MLFSVDISGRSAFSFLLPLHLLCPGADSGSWTPKVHNKSGSREDGKWVVGPLEWNKGIGGGRGNCGQDGMYIKIKNKNEK